MWGVWLVDDDVHVVPCDDKDGVMLNPHTRDVLCICRPEVVEIGEDEKLIISHHEVH